MKTSTKFFILIISVISFAILFGCDESDKSKIADTMREYVQPHLAECESFDFVGLSNHRDTTFMGVPRHCVGVIYTVTDRTSGIKTRHFADVIFSDDFSTALSVNELDFDPIDYVKEKISDALNEKLREKFGN